MHSEPCTKDNLTIGYGNLQFYNIYIYIYRERERERERERAHNGVRTFQTAAHGLRLHHLHQEFPH